MPPREITAKCGACYSDAWYMDVKGGKYRIRCPYCKAETPWGTRSEAVSEWKAGLVTVPEGAVIEPYTWKKGNSTLFPGGLDSD